MTAARDRARPHDEAGFTLVELVVSLLLLTVGVFALMQVFYSSLRVTLTADGRTRATAVATREVEAMRSAPYSVVGMDSSQLGGATTYADTDGHTYAYVTGGLTTPTGTQTISGTVITIKRSIVWVSVGPDAQAYKRAIAIASWKDTSGTHAVRQDSEVYPGGLGPASQTPTSTTSTTLGSSPGGPTGLTATTDSVNPTTAIDLTWTPGTPAGTTWEIDHSLDPSFSSSVTVDTTNQPIGQTTYQKTGLASATTFYFRVRALTGSSSSSWSNIASAATQAPPSPTCTIGTANVTPGFSTRSNNGNTALDYGSDGLYVSVHTNGSCSGLRLSYTPLTPSPTLTPALIKEQGGLWDYTMTSSNTGGWDTGTKDIKVVDGTGTVLAHISFIVCDKNASQCP